MRAGLEGGGVADGNAWRGGGIEIIIYMNIFTWIYTYTLTRAHSQARMHAHIQIHIHTSIITYIPDTHTNTSAGTQSLVNLLRWLFYSSIMLQP